MAKLAIDSASLEFLVINREIFIQNREIGRFSVFLSKIGRSPAKSGVLEALHYCLRLTTLTFETRAKPGNPTSCVYFIVVITYNIISVHGCHHKLCVKKVI